MIQLRSDCLVFEVAGGDKIPCSVEKLTIEVLAESASHLNPDVIQQAAAAVLHYFREDLGRETVTIDEFTHALEDVLRSLGFQVSAETEKAIPNPNSDSAPDRIVEADLAGLAEALGDGLELAFYPRLRAELRQLLAHGPSQVRFQGLRPCAMRLARVRRWCPRSERTSDDIVRFLRECWGVEGPRRDCALVVK